MHACTYCFQYHMHDPLKAICAGFGWVHDTERGVVWVSFVRLPQIKALSPRCALNWNTYKLFYQNNTVVTWPKF